jgi:hypothetical protein
MKLLKKNNFNRLHVQQKNIVFLDGVNVFIVEKILFPAFFIILISTVFLSCCAIKKSDGGYTLIAVIRDADLDYTMLNNIDTITPPYPDGSTYQIGDIGTIKGTYTVYKFMREYEGRSKLSAYPVTFHDLLVVKVDTAGIIVDACKYTLEWTDSPSMALYRLGRKGVRFKTNIDVNELQLTIPVLHNCNEDKEEKLPVMKKTGSQSGQIKK